MVKYWFDHVHLSGPDPDKTAEFYQTLIGAKKTGTINIPGGRILIQLELNGSKFAVSPPNPRPVKKDDSSTIHVLEHFALRTDNIEEAVKDLKAHGIRFLQDVTQAGPGVKISFFLGPDDTLIELMERRPQP